MSEPTRNVSLADPVTHADFQAELARLRSAIALVANCLGPNVISRDDANRLVALLQAPEGRSSRG